MNSYMQKFKDWLTNNMVFVLFSVICIIGIQLSGQPLTLVIDELTGRVVRNTFLVLSLIIPVIAGMGMNFGIVIGAMAGQIAIITAVNFGFEGLPGFLLCVLISTPLAVLFGYLTGLILNKTKGQEMITSMILGFFANGLYQFLFLFLVGTIIPIRNKAMIVSGGVGIKNSLDLDGGLKYALDDAFNGRLKMTLYELLFYMSLSLIVISIAYLGYYLFKHKKFNKKPLTYTVLGVIGFGVCQIQSVYVTLSYPTVPMLTMIIISLLCVFNMIIFKTKLGHDFRIVGQSKQVANASGIDVNKTRIKAIILSTVLAAWGQLIFLQNIGTLNTYGSHEQVGMFATAAILIGGASIIKATNKQAIIGVILFHTLFIVSPTAGQNLFDNAQIGEYFRVFVAYGVICVSLGLYAWKQLLQHAKDI